MSNVDAIIAEGGALDSYNPRAMSEPLMERYREIFADAAARTPEPEQATPLTMRDVTDFIRQIQEGREARARAEAIAERTRLLRECHLDLAYYRRRIVNLGIDGRVTSV